MPIVKVRTKLKQPSFVRLNTLAKGRIIGLREAGTKRGDIALQVKKKDGSAPSLNTVDSVLDRFEEDPEWDGVEDLASAS